MELTMIKNYFAEIDNKFLGRGEKLRLKKFKSWQRLKDIDAQRVAKKKRAARKKRRHAFQAQQANWRLHK